MNSFTCKASDKNVATIPVCITCWIVRKRISLKGPSATRSFWNSCSSENKFRTAASTEDATCTTTKDAIRIGLPTARYNVIYRGEPLARSHSINTQFETMRSKMQRTKSYISYCWASNWRATWICTGIRWRIHCIRWRILDRIHCIIPPTPKQVW